MRLLMKIFSAFFRINITRRPHVIFAMVPYSINKMTKTQLFWLLVYIPVFISLFVYFDRYYKFSVGNITCICWS